MLTLLPFIDPLDNTFQLELKPHFGSQKGLKLTNVSNIKKNVRGGPPVLLGATPRQSHI